MVGLVLSATLNELRAIENELTLLRTELSVKYAMPVADGVIVDKRVKDLLKLIKSTRKDAWRCASEGGSGGGG